MPSGRRGLGCAVCRHETPGGQQFDPRGQQRSSFPLRRRLDGSATHGERNAAARAGPCNSVESNDKAGVKQTVEESYPKWANGRARDPQAEAWCQAKRDNEETSYTASQRESNHAAHQGSGTRSPQVLTALLGLTALSGVTLDKILWELTGHKRCQLFTGPLDVHPHGPQGQRGARPSTVANVVQLRGVVRIDRGGQFSGGNRTAWKHCRFFPDPGTPVQKKRLL